MPQDARELSDAPSRLPLSDSQSAEGVTREPSGLDVYRSGLNVQSSVLDLVAINGTPTTGSGDASASALLALPNFNLIDNVSGLSSAQETLKPQVEDAGCAADVASGIAALGVSAGFGFLVKSGKVGTVALAASVIGAGVAGTYFRSASNNCFGTDPETAPK